MGRQCVSDDVRLNAQASVGFTMFSIKSDCQFVSSLPRAPQPLNYDKSRKLYLHREDNGKQKKMI